jgi:hypothetical protein
MLGVHGNVEAIILPSWMMLPNSDSHWASSPIKCEWTDGLLIDASAGYSIIDGRALGLKADRQLHSAFTWRSEQHIDHKKWAAYCMSYRLDKSESLILPAMPISHLHALAAIEEWEILMPELTKMAIALFTSVRHQAAVEYHCGIRFISAEEAQDIIDTYLLSDKMRRLIDRAMLLRTLSKVGVRQFFQSSIRRDLFDAVSSRVGDVRNGRGLRRLARSHPHLGISELQQIAAGNYQNPVSEEHVAKALAFLSPYRVPSIGVDDTRVWQDIEEGEDCWPSVSRS